MEYNLAAVHELVEEAVPDRECVVAGERRLTYRQVGDRSRQLANALRARGLGVGPSQTNFLLVDFDHPAGPVEAGLVARGVVPRPMAGYGLPTCLRLTVGTRDENRRLLQALDEVME